MFIEAYRHAQSLNCVVAGSDVCISLKRTLFVLFLLVLHCHETRAFCLFFSFFFFFFFLSFFFFHVLHYHKTCALFKVLSIKVLHCHETCALFEPVHGIIVLIAYANSEGSGPPGSLITRRMFRPRIGSTLSFFLSSITSKPHRRTQTVYIVHSGLQDEGLQATNLNYRKVL